MDTEIDDQDALRGAKGILSAIAIAVPLWGGIYIGVAHAAAVSEMLMDMSTIAKALFYTLCTLVIIRAVWLVRQSSVPDLSDLDQPTKT